MKNVFNKILIIIIVASFFSCTSTNNSMDENIAKLYVGEWGYFDKQLNKDATSVSIERISDDEIKIIGFHNLGNSVSTKFRVSDNNLQITSTTIDGLPVEGKGTSNYSYDEITVLYSVDGDDFEANMNKLN